MGAAGWGTAQPYFISAECLAVNIIWRPTEGPGCPVATFYFISKYQSSSLCGGMAAVDCIRNSANMSGVYVHKEAIILVKRYVSESLNKR